MVRKRLARESRVSETSPPSASSCLILPITNLTPGSIFKRPSSNVSTSPLKLVATKSISEAASLVNLACNRASLVALSFRVPSSKIPSILFNCRVKAAAVCINSWSPSAASATFSRNPGSSASVGGSCALLVTDIWSMTSALTSIPSNFAACSMNRSDVWSKKPFTPPSRTASSINSGRGPTLLPPIICHQSSFGVICHQNKPGDFLCSRLFEYFLP